MQQSELAKRYAKALFELALQEGKQDLVFVELNLIDNILKSDKDISFFFNSPLVSDSQKTELISRTLKDAKLDSTTYSFFLLLTKNGRVGFLSQIIEAYKNQNDFTHGVQRGTVRSAVALSPAERIKIEETVSRYTGKQVIFSYKEDPSVIGGLVAEVGSYIFDDTLTSHLKRLKDETMRRFQ
ncbi:MAG: ATP synthase F1 subunit delta [Bdellovibrionales bacterium]|nr:ATP synthase F1 subunit delta [Bdellovibrionales bacterium]